MNLKSIFGGVSIGKDTSGNVKLSAKGLAVRVSDNKYVAAEGNELIDVGGAVFDGGEKYIYRLPVRLDDVQAGDLIITSESPFQALFVIRKRGNSISGLDPRTSVQVDYIPTVNLFDPLIGDRFLV